MKAKFALLIGVRHRIDGLEKHLAKGNKPFAVRHRIDGLEIVYRQYALGNIVRHRIDGLEMSILRPIRA